MLGHWVIREKLESQFRTAKHTDAGSVRGIICDIILDYQRTELEEREAQSPVGKGGSFDLFFTVAEYDFAQD